MPWRRLGASMTFIITDIHGGFPGHMSHRGPTSDDGCDDDGMGCIACPPCGGVGGCTSTDETSTGTSASTWLVLASKYWMVMYLPLQGGGEGGTPNAACGCRVSPRACKNLR
jgi:hypothetical protein